MAEPLSYKQVVLSVFPEAIVEVMVDTFFGGGQRYEAYNFDPMAPQNEGLRPRLLGIGVDEAQAWRDAYIHLRGVDRAIANRGIWTLTEAEQVAWSEKLPLLELPTEMKSANESTA
jgi:hypothetical protein